MRFVLMRHASAASATGIRDEGRPLTAEGRREAAHAAAWLAGADPPARIVASPSLRTQETARAVAARLGSNVATDARIYEASLGDLVDVLAGGGDVVLVGHNPGLEHLVEHLVQSGHVPWQRMAPASVAILSGELRRAGCRLESWWQPEQ